MRAREVVSKIEANGGYFVRQRGSHAIYRANVGDVAAQTVVPMHTGDIPNGTLRAIEKDLAPAFGKGWLQ